MRGVGVLLGLLLLVAVPGAQAAAPAPPVALQLTYVTYAAGFTTVRLGATLELGPEGYRLAIDYHTVSMIGFLFPGHDQVTAEGTWQSGAAVPLRFESQGKWGGKRFTVLMDYPNGEPEARRLAPKEASKRESVPAALRMHTVDTLSALALLSERMEDGAGCRMALRIFDGRRLIALDSEPAGNAMLGETTRSFFHGRAERCDITGRMLAGFLRSDGPQARARVHRGVVWFAHPIPGLPLLPVRIAFSTSWFGTAMTYLTDIQAASPAVRVVRRVASAPALSDQQGAAATR